MKDKTGVLDFLPNELKRIVKEFYKQLKDKRFSELTKNNKKNLKEILEKLYWNYSLSLRKIALLFERDYDTIYKWFQKLNIRKRNPEEAAALRRNPNRKFLLKLLPPNLQLEIEKCRKELKPRKVNLPSQLLRKLYIESELSISKISILFGVSRRTIKKLLQKFGIKARRSIQKRIIDEKKRNILLKIVPLCVRNTINKIYQEFEKKKSLGLQVSSEKIPKEILEYLYLKHKLSSREIGILFGLSAAKIRKRLEKYNIPRRSVSEALTKYPKNPFVENNKEMTKLKCYLLGLRCGDLHAFLDDKRVVCTVSTTHPAWEKLMNNLFRDFGPIRKYPFENRKGEYAWRISTYLNESFSFLLAKLNSIPSWILLDKELFLNFLAGITDSEGSIVFDTYKNYMRFGINIVLTDLRLVEDIATGLRNIGFNPILFKGKRSKNHFGKRDIWNLRIEKKKEVKKLLEILPLRHEEKIKKVKIALQSNHKSIEEVKQRWKLLSNKIKKDVIEYKKLAENALKFG